MPPISAIGPAVGADEAGGRRLSRACHTRDDCQPAEAVISRPEESRTTLHQDMVAGSDARGSRNFRAAYDRRYVLREPYLTAPNLDFHV